MAHSKSNTSRAVFTSHERAMARAAWGASAARLTRESFLPFASCCLCLEPAREPVACAAGDIFCRECALSNILAQKKEIRRLEKDRARAEREALEARAREDAEAQARAVREFELMQAGFDMRRGRADGDGVDSGKDGGRRGSGAGAGGGESRKNGEKRETPLLLEAGDSAAAPVKKRKFELDEDELLRVAEEDRAKARKAIDDEKAAKPTLPSFWTPSVTPSSNKNDVLHEVKRKVKTSPLCPAAPEDRPHYYSLHTLVTINFTEEAEDVKGSSSSSSSSPSSHQRVCPSCKKALTNSSKAVLAKPCGHVLCGSCANQFMRPSHDPHAPEPDAVRCYVCDADLTETKKPEKAEKAEKAEKGAKADKEKIRPGIVELRSEGTGFSAAGTNEVKKIGVGFQY